LAPFYSLDFLSLPSQMRYFKGIVSREYVDVGSFQQLGDWTFSAHPP
jgi:hypothetical protein